MTMKRREGTWRLILIGEEEGEGEGRRRGRGGKKVKVEGRKEGLCLLWMMRKRTKMEGWRDMGK